MATLAWLLTVAAIDGRSIGIYRMPRDGSRPAARIPQLTGRTLLAHVYTTEAGTFAEHFDAVRAASREDRDGMDRAMRQAGPGTLCSRRVLGGLEHAAAPPREAFSSRSPAAHGTATTSARPDRVNRGTPGLSKPTRRARCVSRRRRALFARVPRSASNSRARVHATRGARCPRLAKMLRSG